MSRYVQPRDWLVNRLEDNLQFENAIDSIQKVLVIGGGPNEPELSLFGGTKIEFHFAGIEGEKNVQNFHYLDLNIPSEPWEEFDLVLCNQVLEHVYNLQNAFENMRRLVKTQGFLWVACPANNYRHGSPNFYSAGYSQEFLSTNLEILGFRTIDSGELSSKRIYLFRHLVRIWPTDPQIKYPLITYFGKLGNFAEKVSFNLRTILARVLIALSSRNLNLNGDYPLETFGFYAKSE